MILASDEILFRNSMPEEEKDWLPIPRALAAEEDAESRAFFVKAASEHVGSRFPLGGELLSVPWSSVARVTRGAAVFAGKTAHAIGER